MALEIYNIQVNQLLVHVIYFGYGQKILQIYLRN